MLKKLLSALLVLSLLCGCATKTSKSFETDTKEESSTAVKEEDVMTRAEELGVTAYRQDDPQWGNDVMKPSSDTMRQSGCLVTAIASAVTMNGHKMTPGDMNALFVKKGVYDTSGNTLWEQLRKIKHYHVIVYNTTARATLDECLKKKRYPIICTHSLKSGNPHYVLVVNKDGKDYDVMDPKFDDLTRLSDYDYDIKLIRCVYFK